MTRAFIIGNGPSLKDTNLDLIAGEVSFACNRIHLLYDRTRWRPTHYVRAESSSLKGAEKYHIEIQTHLDLGCEVWSNKWFTKNTDMAERCKTIVSCWHYRNHYYDSECPHEWHLGSVDSPKLCTFGSSVNVAMQIAVLQGYRPLYLLGCDLNYKDNAPSHFTDEYEKGIEEELRSAHFANLDTLTAHMVARRSSHVSIFNCTPYGLLHDLGVYENVRLEDVV